MLWLWGPEGPTYSVLAGEQGFEPQSSDPESDVLPIKLFPIGYATVEMIPQQDDLGKF